jgi:hypothetical protein
MILAGAVIFGLGIMFGVVIAMFVAAKAAP